MTIKTFIKRHPILIYCALVFAISWGGMLIAVGPGGIPANGEQSEILVVYAYVAMLVGPGVASILLIAILDGPAGLRELASRLLKWRVALRWYAVALLTAPLLTAAVLLALSLLSSDFIPRLYTTDDRAFLLQYSIVSALMVGVFEELGWTGFVVPRVRLRYGVVKTGLIVGLIFAVWNALVVFWVSDATGTAGTLPMVVFLPAVLLTWLPAYRVLMVWVNDRTESLLVAILMHTSHVAFWTMLTPLTITGVPLLTYYLVYTAALWLIIAAVAAASRGQLSPQPPRTRMA